MFHPQNVAIADLTALAVSAEQEMKAGILPFWLKNTRNADNGGFHGFIDAAMAVRKGANRGGLLTCRILWTFSAAYRRYQEPAYFEMARWAYRDLMDHFWDGECGGLFWTISEQGQPRETNKLIYLQVFGIFALSEYYRATGEQLALEKSIAIYQLIEKHSRDHEHGGYRDTLDRKWGKLEAARRYLLGSAPKSQNSHVHILEAYTNLLRIWPDRNLWASQRDLIAVVTARIIDPRTHHSNLFMTEDWTPIGENVSYGHDIELSWLLLEAAGVLGEPSLVAAILPVSREIASVTMAEGIDADGGLINEGGPHGYTNTDKDWWSQAEAVVGFLNAYQITGDSRYFEASRRCWNYIDAKFVDRVHGDWIERVRRDGTPIPRPKVTLWKCPYHSSRACLELVERVHRLTSAAPAP